MVIDKLVNSDKYLFENKRISTAIEYLKSADFSLIEDGKYNIDGENIIIIISTYITKYADISCPEAHKKYIDVQYVVSGSELVGYLPYEGQDVYKEYDEENDYMLFDEECSYFRFKEGMFAVFFPEDLHKPGIKDFDNSEVRKIVIKVMV